MTGTRLPSTAPSVITLHLFKTGDYISATRDLFFSITQPKATAAQSLPLILSAAADTSELCTTESSEEETSGSASLCGLFLGATH